ncbi:MAG: hypothetical protein GOU98_02850 [Candidatus Altiarchaeota archaeon]|nr:hypothetical protein [Candidatus Altiarchaeota archaeon]
MTTLFEVSFECGNKVGGIWTVITSKSAFIQKNFPNYYTIGFYNPDNTEVIEKPAPPFLKKAFSTLSKKGITCKFGSWIYANDSNIILVDAKKFQKEVNAIKGLLWEKFGIDSLDAGFDFDEPLAWSYAIGMLIEEITKNNPGKNIVQLHEWLTGGALLYLKLKNINAHTVFTTHATVLGRATGGNIPKKPDEEARKRNVTAKHLLEKAAARNADVFTTVSDATGVEAEKILGRKPDIITYNAMGKVSDLASLMKDKVMYRKKIDEFVRAYFFPYYPLNLKDYPVIYTAGRYEFLNKGYDAYIDSLGLVNKKLKEINYKGWVLAFILVPAGTLGVKEEVSQNFSFYKRMKEVLKEDVEKISEEVYSLQSEDDVASHLSEILVDLKKLKSRIATRQGKNPPICAFQLSSGENNDEIIKRLIQNDLLNRPEDKVKVVYFPTYINKQDDLLGLKYKDFLIAASMGVFLSRYEPWGYTPMEAASYLSSSITTKTAGFGMALSKLNQLRGIYLTDANSPKETSQIISDFILLSKNERLDLEVDAHKVILKNFIWDTLGTRYLKAYSKL